AADFVGEVDVAGGVDEVQLVGLPVARLVVQGHAVGLDGDAALALQVHGVQHLGRHFAVAQATTDLDETVSQGGFAVVDVGNDGKVADMAQVAHGTSLVRPREIPAEKIVRDSTRWPGGASRPPPKGALVQWVMLWGGVHTGWEESVGPGLSRPAKAGWTAATADTPSAGIKPAPQGVRGAGAGPG